MNKKLYMLKTEIEDISYKVIGKADSLKEFLILAISDLPEEIININITTDSFTIIDSITDIAILKNLNDNENYWYNSREYKSN